MSFEFAHQRVVQVVERQTNKYFNELSVEWDVRADNGHHSNAFLFVQVMLFLVMVHSNCCSWFCTGYFIGVIKPSVNVRQRACLQRCQVHGVISGSPGDSRSGGWEAPRCTLIYSCVT